MLIKHPKTRSRRQTIVALIAFWLLVSVATVSGQEIGEKPENLNIEMLTCNILVLDPDGNPIEDATVVPVGLRARKNPNRSIRVWTEEYGPVPKRQTDVNGFVEMIYPKLIVDDHQVGIVNWSVTHQDFVGFRGDRSVDEDPAEFQLERGFRIAVTAVNPSGNRITEDLYAEISGHSATDWSLKKNGMLVSPVFAKNQATLRVVQLTKGQPPLFSNRINVAPGEDSRVLLQDVELALGTRVEGRLADSVTRPIKNGYVGAYIVRTGKNPDDWNAKWFWADSAPIAEDGTFVFPSLPSGEVVQLTAMCDGWVPSQPTIESVRKFYPTKVQNLASVVAPHLFALDDTKINPILSMNRGADCQITVIDSAGNPVRDATVFCSPNQIWFEGGSTLLGAAYQMRELLELARAGQQKQFQFNMARFKSKTDENGVAVLKHLPAVAELRFYVEHESYEMPILDAEDASMNARSQTVLLKPGEVVNRSVEMQIKATEALGVVELKQAEDKND